MTDSGCLKIFVGILVLSVAYCAIAPDGPGKSSSVMISSTPRMVFRARWGCIDADDTERIYALAAQNDDRAINRLLASLSSAGKCHLFDRGASVVVVGLSSFRSYARLRRSGDYLEFWTPNDVFAASAAK